MGAACSRVEQIVELRKLKLGARTGRTSGKRCSSDGDPPGEALRLPHPASARRNSASSRVVAAAGRMLDQRARQMRTSARREVQALRAGRRHDMRRVAGEEQPAEAHRLGDETAQRRDALLDRGAGDEPRAASSSSRRLAPPRSVVRPILDVSVSGTAGSSGWRGDAHRAEREAARAVDVDQLVARPAASRRARRASRTDRRFS